MPWYNMLHQKISLAYLKALALVYTRNIPIIC